MDVQGVNQDVDHKDFRFAKDILEWVQAILVALALGFLVKTFVFTLVLVEGPSMNPTLHTGDRLFISRLFYKPKVGDVVVFKPENDAKPYIKRVIAVPGQVVDIDFETHAVYVDGKLLDEPYILEPTSLRGDMSYPLTVPKDEVFVMGDNRNNSEDSRRSKVGTVEYKAIMGKAIFRWWPLDKIGLIK